MDVSSACCCIIYDSLFWRCQPRVRVINIDQVFSKKGARKEDGGREISLTWCQFCVKLRGGSKRRKSCCLNSIWFMSIDEIYNTVIVQQTIVHNTRKVLEANDAVNSMRCQVLYFIKTCREKKKKGISNSRARRDVDGDHMLHFWLIYSWRQHRIISVRAFSLDAYGIFRL